MTTTLLQLRTTLFEYISSSPKKIKSWGMRLWEKDVVKYVCGLYALGFLMFGYILLTNSFTISLGGDFVLQEIPFIFNGHDDWWTFFKTGEFPYWDTSGMLGSNNIGSNSFYYIFSPWFLISLFCPRSLLPQFQSILTISKMVFAGLMFYYYLGSFKLSKKSRMLGGLVYAFCGWQMFYLWFYHFGDVAIFLPMMLWGVEKVFKEKNPLLLIASIFLCGMANYYFLACFMIGAFIYAMFRYFQMLNERTYKNNLIVLGIGVLGFVVGLLLTSFIIIPSGIAIANMPRNDSSFLDQIKNAGSLEKQIKMMFFWPAQEEYKTIYPLSSFLFINTGCFSQTLFTPSGYDNAGSSMYVFAPMTLMLIPSLIYSLKQKKISYLIAFIGVCFMLFTPFFYYAFHGFTVGYGRWEIIAVAFMIPLLCMGIDNRKKISRTSLDVSIIVVLVLMFITYLYILKYQGTTSLKPLNGEETTIIIVQALYTILIYILMRIQFHKTRFSAMLTGFIAVEAIVMANLTVYGHGLSSFKSLSGGVANVKEETRIAAELTSYDDSFFRIFNTSADRSNNNLAMQEGYNGVATFHSVYDFEMRDFIDWSGIAYSYGNWSMGVHEKRNNLDTFIGVKYYLVKKTDINIPYGYSDIRLKNDIPSSLKSILDEGTHSVYVNDNYIPLGFSYDTFVPESKFLYGGANAGVDSIYADYNEVSYLSQAIVSQDIMAEMVDYSHPTFKKGSLDPLRNQIVHIAPNSENTQVIKARWTGQRYEYDDLGQYSSAKTKGLPWYSNYVMTLDDNNLICPSSENGCYVSAQAVMGENLKFDFYDINGELVTSDTHMVHWYSRDYDAKNARGFYVDRPIKKVVMTINENLAATKSLPIPQFYVQDNANYQNSIDMQRLFPMEEISSTVNTTTFKTEYESERFNILNTPYDKGFSLSAKIYDDKGVYLRTEDLKIYKAQGGFVSFVAPEGKVIYQLSYYPPGMELGNTGLFVGVIITLGLFEFYYHINYKKKIMKMLEIGY